MLIDTRRNATTLEWRASTTAVYAGLLVTLTVAAVVTLVVTNDGSVAAWITSGAVNAVALIVLARTPVDKWQVLPLGLTPYSLLALFLALPLVIRVALVPVSGIGTWQTGFVAGDGNDSTSIASRAALSLGLVTFVAGARISASVQRRHLPALQERDRATRSTTDHILLLCGALILSLGATAFVLADLGFSLESLQRALAARQELWAGQTYLLFLLQSYKIAVMIFVGLRLADHKAVPLPLLILLWIPTIPFDLFSGSRLDLVLRNLLPFTVIAVLCLRRRSSRMILAVTVLIAAVFSFNALRDSIRAYDPPERTLVAESSRDWSDDAIAFFTGDEVAMLDSTRLVVAGVTGETAHPRGLEGVAAAALSVVPSAVWAEKPLRGGEYATQNFKPDLYERKGNIAIGGFADLLLIGGFWLIPVGGSAIGVIASIFLTGFPRISMRFGGTFLGTISGAFAVATVTPFLRSDLSELPVSTIRWAMFFAVLALFTRRRSPRETAD